MPYHERPFAAVSPTLRSTLQKSSENLIVNSSPRSSVLVIVYITSSPKKTLDAAVVVLEKDNTPFNYPILNSCSLKTVSSTDASLNLDDCILHYSPMCYLNFVHIVRLTLHFILCNRFCVLLLHSICNSVRMTCWIKRRLILSYLISLLWA